MQNSRIPEAGKIPPGSSTCVHPHPERRIHEFLGFLQDFKSPSKVWPTFPAGNSSTGMKGTFLGFPTWSPIFFQVIIPPSKHGIFGNSRCHRCGIWEGEIPGAGTGRDSRWHSPTADSPTTQLFWDFWEYREGFSFRDWEFQQLRIWILLKGAIPLP